MLRTVAELAQAERMTKDPDLDSNHLNGPFLGSHAISEGWLRRRDLSSPRFVRLFQNVYVPAAVPITHELRCRAAACIAPRTATLTGCSAAAVRGFEFAAANDPVEFVVDDYDKFTAQRGVDIRRSTTGPVAGDPWQGIQIATPMRMTLDILTNTKLRRSLPRTVGLLDAILRSGIVDRDRLAAMLEQRHDRGIVRARRACELADPRAESIPESEVRVWLALAGIRTIPQFRVRRADGEFLGRLDLAVEGCQVAVEYDGKWHAKPEQARRDAEHRRRLAAAGWTFVIVTSEQLYGQPQAVVDAVRDAVLRRTGHLSTYAA